VLPLCILSDVPDLSRASLIKGKGVYQIARSLDFAELAMAIGVSALESAIHDAIPITHLEIVDTSSGCGENYTIVVVSEVRTPSNNLMCGR
jgi:hypothetical protein